MYHDCLVCPLNSSRIVTIHFSTAENMCPESVHNLFPFPLPVHSSVTVSVGFLLFNCPAVVMSLLGHTYPVCKVYM